MNEIDIQIVDYNSGAQKKSVELRYKVLREPLGLHFTPEQLAEEKEEVHIVGMKGEEVIGVVVLKKMEDNIFKMRQVAVDPEYQRKGIGKKMVHFSELYAARHGYDAIELHARDTAKDFYLSMGYDIMSDAFYEVGILHYKMRKYFTN
jgi:ribosomal protein S18 acetylase RimI-like enzyme